MDIAAWNVAFYPRSASAPAAVQAFVEDSSLDLLGLVEVADGAAFDALVASLPSFEGVLSPPTGAPQEQRLGLLWRASNLTVTSAGTLFDADPDWIRPAMRARVTPVNGDDFLFVLLHLKAGTTVADEQQRQAQVADLDAWIQAHPEADVVIAGDWNVAPGDAMAASVMAPFLGSPARYDVPSWDLALGGEVTFLPADVMLDHVAYTEPVALAVPAVPPVQVLHLDETIASYVNDVSDHRPLVLRVER